MSGPEHTVVALKSSFLRSQIRILSQPLQPTQRWRDNSATQGVLTNSARENAVREVNRQLRRHTKAAYSTLAVRHVAEQIDKLYWDAGEPDFDADNFEDPDDGVLRVGDDLADAKTIEKLPATWDHEEGAVASAKQQAYEEALRNLMALQAQREAALKKLAAIKELHATLKPFSQPQTNVQPNIVTRDGQLASEMDRCRELSVRVGARMGTFQKRQSMPLVDNGSMVSFADSTRERLKNAWNAT